MTNWLIATGAFLILLFIRRPIWRTSLIILVPLSMVAVDWLGMLTSFDHILGYPFSDANGYFHIGLGLAKNFPISEWGGRRPFYSVFLGSLFSIAGPHLWAIYALQSLLVGVCLSLFDRIVFRRYGRMVAAFSAYVILIFGSRFYSNTLTENLGLPLGLLSLSFLLVSSQINFRLAALSVFFLSLGMVARAGAAFCIPLLAWALWRHLYPQKTWTRKKLLGGMGLVLSAGLVFLLLKAVIHWLVVPGAMSFSNFSYTLYGLVSGGQPWSFVLTEHPELKTLFSDDVARSREIYRLAGVSFLADPILAVKGVLLSWWTYILPSITSAFGFMGYGSPKFLARVPTPLFMVFTFFGIYRIFRRKQSDPSVTLLRPLILGIFFSIPFVQPIDADMMRAYAVTIPISALVVGHGLIQILEIKNRYRTSEILPTFLSFRALASVSAIYLFLLLLPFAWVPKLKSSSGQLWINYPLTDPSLAVDPKRGTFFTRADSGREIEWGPRIHQRLNQFGYPHGDHLDQCLKLAKTGHFGAGRNSYGSGTFIFIQSPEIWLKLMHGEAVPLQKAIHAPGPLQVYTDFEPCWEKPSFSPDPL